MRDAPTITKELIASGLSQPQQALLMELILTMSSGISASNPVESPEYRTLEKRRAWDRERKRAAKLRSAYSTGIPPETDGNPPDVAEIPCLLREEEGVSKGSVLEKKESKKGKRLNASARMTTEDRAFAETLIPPESVESEWAGFVDYWISVPGSRGCKLNWPATWRNRVRDVAKKYGGRSGNGISNHRADPAAGRATAREVHAVTTVADAALQRLRESKSAGSVGKPSGDASSAEVLDFGGRAKNAG